MVSVDDEALEAAAQYFWYADRFGWLPTEVEELPAWLRDRLPTVAAVHDEIKAEKEREANR